MPEDYISILVSCYNSKDTVIEALESIEKQTYKNLDLFINDDTSSDDSVEKIENWIEKMESVLEM